MTQLISSLLFGALALGIVGIYGVVAYVVLHSLAADRERDGLKTERPAAECQAVRTATH